MLVSKTWIITGAKGVSDVHLLYYARLIDPRPCAGAIRPKTAAAMGAYQSNHEWPIGGLSGRIGNHAHNLHVRIAQIHIGSIEVEVREVSAVDGGTVRIGGVTVVKNRRNLRETRHAKQKQQ